MSTQESVIYPAEFVGGSTWRLRQMGSGNWSGNQQMSDCIPSGATRRHASTTDNLAPVFEFTTEDLLTVLTNISLTAGFYCSGGATFYWQQRDLGAGFVAGSNHFKLTSYRGLLVPRSISANEGKAQVGFDYHDLWDENASHRVSEPTASQALGAQSPSFISEYYRGTATLNGTEIDLVTSLSIDFAALPQKKLFAGQFAPSRMSLPIFLPIISIGTDNIGEYAEKVVNSEGAAFTNLIIYFRKGSAGAARGGAGTAISITAASGQVCVGNIAGPGNGNAQAGLIFKPTADLSVNLGATHP